jgi:hypothetical protein
LLETGAISSCLVAMHVAEIAVRLGDTTLEIARVGAGDRFTIGARPGVQLAVAGIGEFPLVESRGTQFVVRAPVGTPLRSDDRLLDERERVLVPHSRVSLVLGLARVDIELVRVEPTLVPRPAFDARPAAYTGASLFAHVVLWAAAGVIAPFVPFVHHRPQRPRLVSIASVDPPPAPKPATPRPVELDDAAPSPSPSPRFEIAKVRQHAIQSTAEVARMFDAIDVRGKLDQVGPVYGGEYKSGDFGTAFIFDPDKRPEFDTIKTGRFETISRGSGAGDDFDRCSDGHMVEDPQHPGHHICVPDQPDQK